MRSREPDKQPARAGLSRRRFLQGAAGGAAFLAGLQSRAPAALGQAPCSYPNPIANENRCTPASEWGRGFAIVNYASAISGFATKTSVDVGEPVDLKLVGYDDFNGRSATLEVWRLGYYGGHGGRLVHTQSLTLPGFASGGQGDVVRNTQFGLDRCGIWSVTATIAGAHTAVSGLYMARIKARGSGVHSDADYDNQIPFIVRDDARARDLLVALPTNTWQAYNNWDRKSLYTQQSWGDPTDAGSHNGQSRALKVSFDRPWMDPLGGTYNWPLRTEFPLIWWLEQQGYDLAYTDDFGLHSQAAQLLPANTKTLVIAGHSEYWTGEAFDNVKAARDAGTNIASFSANTAYWKVRLEDAGRTLVCFKTVMGTQANAADNGTLGVNDYGPGQTGRTGGPNDPLGADRARGGAGANADKPQFVTTTFRDPGAPDGDPNAPDDNSRGHGRVGPDKPENQLFGVMYVGDDDDFAYPLHVPAGSGNGGEFGAHPAWRHTPIANGSGADIGTNLVGWEFDGIPRGGPYAGYVGRQPAGVRRLSETTPSGGTPAYLQDAGRTYASTPHPQQGGQTQAVTYRAAGGAQVFASGTMQWSFGLGPHFEWRPATPTVQVRFDGQAQAVIRQATYNVLKDMGVAPATPEGIIEDSVGGTTAPPTSGPPQPAPAAVAPRLRLGRSRQVLTRRGAVKMRLTCRASEVRGALGELTLFALLPPRRRGGRPRRRKLGARAFYLRAGQSRVLHVRLSRRNRAFLKKVKRARVQAVVHVRDPAGNKRRQTSTFSVLSKRPARR